MSLLNLSYTKSKIKNGLEVIIHQDKSLPLVAVNIWYKVGSANEKPDKTGLAHLFEHMMFQGSENVAKEMHFKYIQEAGGILNGSTSFDRTNYYEKLPSNALETALWLESDRMGFLLKALDESKLENQKSVVVNERLERYDNQPYGLAWELIVKNLFPEGHPYSWPTIGFKKDIESFSLDDVINFFKLYYSPSNATLVIAGDVDIQEAIILVEKYFGEIPSFETPAFPQTENFSLAENLYVEHKDNVQLQRLYLAFPTVKCYQPSDAEYEILSDILSGSKNSRLNKRLVFDEQIAQDVSAFQFAGKYGGMFIIVSTAKPGVKLSELKQKIFEEISLIVSNGITEKEFIKTQNGIKSNFISAMQNIDHIADHLNHYNFYLGEPNSFEFDINRYQSVNPDDVQKIAKDLISKNYLELNIIQKEN
ncbi:pitrilysin family protein [Ignavibacterium sp.]|uniref:M16 family metallopeptidase n=1 Tax=Ignavibacterium sp. TaxID=2651167 RepID=UPI00307D7199